MNCLLVIDTGSSSIKFGIFDILYPENEVLTGAVIGLGQPNARLSLKKSDGESVNRDLNSNPMDSNAVLGEIISCLNEQVSDLKIAAVGHRIVHGGPKHIIPKTISPQVIADLKGIAPLSPKHLPVQINYVEALISIFPGSKQIACFDTTFHSSLPNKAQMLPIPRRYFEKGVRKYGFHGLSVESIIDQLKIDSNLPQNVIVAHMGSGVSLTAVKNGQSIDTTMSLSPNSGVPMSSRSGDIDPGLITYLATSDNLSTTEITELLSSKSGLLGISDTTADMEQLLAVESTHEPSQQAIELFCYNITKQIGAFSAALGGLDCLVFTGGMGEIAPRIRSLICEQLGFLGIKLDEQANTNNQAIISSGETPTIVKILPSNEIKVIAQHCQSVLNTQT